MGIFESFWPFFFPLLAAIISIVHIRMRDISKSGAVGNFLMWQLAIGFGLAYVYAGSGHLLLSDKIAESIGWPAGSPFQLEVGIWDAAMGICGFLCLKFKDDFWTAVIIGPGLFSIGAGLGHIRELVMLGDTAPNNAGPVMYMDLLYPLFLAGLLIWYRKLLEEENTGLPGI
jgi:hypothetical protein